MMTSDLISREGLIETIRAEKARAEKREIEATKAGYEAFYGSYTVYRLYQKMIKIVQDEPAVEAGPDGREKGRWIYHRESGMIECSECHEHNVDFSNISFYLSKAGIRVLWDFCPDCGADMREESDDD